MNSFSWVIFHGFLQKCSIEKRKSLLSCLPENIQTLNENLPLTYKDVTEGIDSTAILDFIHYSWLEPLIRKRTENEIRLIISALNSFQVKGLKKALLFTSPLYPLTPIAKKFFRKTLLKSFLEKEEVLPPECLPESPLNELLNLNPEELCSLASFLGIRDLSVEMRVIIDKVKIKQIQNALSEHELLYLKTLMQQKEPIIFKPLGLANNKWDGNAHELKALLMQRGMNRLAKALRKEHNSLIWYVSHKLDNEMGQMLMSFSTPFENERASSLLTNQVIELIPYIQNLSLSAP